MSVEEAYKKDNRRNGNMLLQDTLSSLISDSPRFVEFGEKSRVFSDNDNVYVTLCCYQVQKSCVAVQ